MTDTSLIPCEICGRGYEEKDMVNITSVHRDWKPTFVCRRCLEAVEPAEEQRREQG